MAENESAQQTNTSPVQTAASAGQTALNIGKAAAKAGAGDFAGAAIDLAKDQNVRRTVVACLLLVVFIFLSVFLLVGSAITGTIDALYTSFTDNWNENWEEQGVSSEGNVLYLYSIGLLDSLGDTIGDTIAEIGAMIENLFVIEDKADNSDLSGTSPITNEDYQTMLESLKDTDALIGENGALQRRINMIKNRVSQRGEQIRQDVSEQYASDALGLLIGETLTLALTDPILFNGVERTNFSYDYQAFELTDLQALKILAAYSIQHDVVFSDADMWDLMDYCGWYALDLESIDNNIFGSDSIYNSTTKGSFTMSFGNQIQAGDDLQTLLSGTSYQLKDPEIKRWNGNFAPQWYYDQIAQLKANNELYDKLASAGDTEALEGMIRYETDADGNIVLDNFAALGSYQTYGLIDKLYTATEATVTISRTEYEEATVLNEALAQSSETLRLAWEKAFHKETYEITTDADNRLSVDESEAISYTFLNTTSGYSYTLIRCYDGALLEPVRASSHGQEITFTDLLPGTDYIAFYQDYTDNLYEIEFFTTPDLWTAPTAYKLIFDLDITYTSRSIEQLIYDLMGLWPGDLKDTEIGPDGVEYAAGHIGNDLLRKSWTDTYTDSEGNSHTITFERSQGYQVEAYNDMLQAIALLLEYDTTGLTAPDYGYGNSIVDMAEKELAYYTAQGMYGGMRYWDKAKSIIGWNYGADLGWCSCFILCCAYDCGFIGEGQCFGDLGTNWPFSCGGLWTALSETGTAECYSSQTDAYCPVPGDLVFFDSTFGIRDFAHVGIVKEVLPDGSLITIEGNTGKRVGQCTYSNYSIGTYCYTNTNGKPIYITAYIHPDYPASYNTAPKYLSISGSTEADIKMRPLALENELYLAGLPRFRISQLPAVADALTKDFPALHTTQLREAIETGKPEQILEAWNTLCSSGQADAFRNAQLQIYTEHFAQPLAAQLLQNTGFNWTGTKLREELFLGIATTTDSETALQKLFESISKNISPNISDSELLTALTEEDLLKEMLNEQKSFLWPTDPESIRASWIQSILTLLTTLDAS